MYGVATLSKGGHPARGPVDRRSGGWIRLAAPGRAERIVVGVLLWVGSVLAFLLIESAIGVAASSLGMAEKTVEFAIGLAFLPTYFTIRHVWLKMRAILLPSEIDLHFRRRHLRRRGDAIVDMSRTNKRRPEQCQTTAKSP